VEKKGIDSEKRRLSAQYNLWQQSPAAQEEPKKLHTATTPYKKVLEDDGGEGEKDHTTKEKLWEKAMQKKVLRKNANNSFPKVR